MQDIRQVSSKSTYLSSPSNNDKTSSPSSALLGGSSVRNNLAMAEGLKAPPYPPTNTYTSALLQSAQKLPGTNEILPSTYQYSYSNPPNRSLSTWNGFATVEGLVATPCSPYCQASKPSPLLTWDKYTPGQGPDQACYHECFAVGSEVHQLREHVYSLERRIDQQGIDTANLIQHLGEVLQALREDQRGGNVAIEELSRKIDSLNLKTDESLVKSEWEDLMSEAK